MQPTLEFQIAVQVRVFIFENLRSLYGLIWVCTAIPFEGICPACMANETLYSRVLNKHPWAFILFGLLFPAWAPLFNPGLLFVLRVFFCPGRLLEPWAVVFQ